MITDVRIKNFQSHADTELILSPFVTVFTGDSDQGKTAIFRALKKLFRNTPAGNFFIRWGEEVCEIEACINDISIVRKVSKNDNVYTVGKDKYSKFNRDIPEEVRLALGISDIQIFGNDKIDFNIQSQHSDLFMVGGTGVASLRGRIFCKVTGSEKINTAITIANSEALEANKQIKLLKVTVEDFESRLSKYSNLDTIKGTLDYIKNQLDIAQRTAIEIDDLENVRSRLSSVTHDIQVISKRLTAYDAVDLATIQLAIIEFEKLSELSKSLSGVELQLDALRYVSNINLDIDFTPADQASEEYYQILDIKKQATHFKSSWYEIKDAKQIKEALLKDKVQELEDFKHQLGICPTCDRPFE